MRWRTIAFAFDLSTMPLHSRWPMFEVSESTLRPSASRATREVLTIGDPEVAVEAALEVGRLAFELMAYCSSCQTSRAKRAPRTLAS